MATTRSFQSMLNQYLPNELLREEMIKRDWILQNVEKDDSWLGGDLIVPFKGQQASSVAFGSLTGSTDIAEDAYVRGSITTQPEVWGTMIFNHRDIMEHNKVSEQNFLKLLPDTIEDFMDFMKQCVSLSFLNGPAFASLITDGTSGGSFTTDRPERFVLKQKVYFKGTAQALSAAGYVQSIVMDTGTITVDTTRAGGADLDISAYTVADAAKVYFDGSSTAGLTSLKLSLLSSANGGSSTLYGQTKTAYPYLQAINVSGASTNSSTILTDIFNAFVTIKTRGKGMPDKAILSYRNFGWVMTILEIQKGSYHIDQTSRKVSAFGWEEVTVYGPKGRLVLVAIQEMDNDSIFFLDTRPSVMKVYSNGGFRKRVNPDGREFFEVRNTTGYQYIIDACFFGDFVLQRPSYCGILYGIV